MSIHPTDSRLWNGFLLALFWIILWAGLWYEWEVNELYSYGMLVPLLGVYLIFRRWQDRPDPLIQTEKSAWIVPALFLLVLLQYPLHILYGANAEWRLLLWVQAGTVFLASALLVFRWGGLPWLKHFAFPLLFFLTAVPWPTRIEQELVSGLMNLIATCIVDVVNFFGIHARQQGNIIQLSSGFVQIEEACSGIRSFQSSLMAAFFLGEMYRFGLTLRILLVAGAAFMAVLLNFGRTMLLTIISYRSGEEGVDYWHDPAGYLIFVAIFLFLGVLCHVFRHRGKGWSEAPSESSGDVVFGSIPLSQVSPLVLILLAAVPSAWLWYGVRAPKELASTDWSFNWEALGPEATRNEISDRIQEILRYADGEYWTWFSENGWQWMAYSFVWDEPKAAQLGGVHNPEACLPSTGWALQQKREDWIWQGPSGLKLAFNVYEFEARMRHIFVFYAQWDPSGYPYHLYSSRLRKDRILDAWYGYRHNDKRKIEFIVAGPRSFEQARDAMEEILDDIVVAGDGPR